MDTKLKDKLLGEVSSAFLSGVVYNNTSSKRTKNLALLHGRQDSESCPHSHSSASDVLHWHIIPCLSFPEYLDLITFLFQALVHMCVLLCLEHPMFMVVGAIQPRIPCLCLKQHLRMLSWIGDQHSWRCTGRVKFVVKWWCFSSPQHTGARGLLSLLNGILILVIEVLFFLPQQVVARVVTS